jgi:small subunit ribosomal protein S6
MRQYEVTFIIDPVLPSEEINGVAKNYQEQLGQEGCEIVNVDAMGLRQLAYPIHKRSSGIYYCIEFTSPGHDSIDKLELALRRDERIMRFLTVKLDKYGVKYNSDKRAGLIGKSKKESKKDDKDDSRAAARKSAPPAPVAVKPAPVEAKPVVKADEEE